MSLQNTHFGAKKIEEMLKNCKSVFFVGIGGINMSSLAHVSKKNGYRVGGSDRVRSALTERLEGEGIDIRYSHDAQNVEGYDVLVYTVAISEDNPEYLRATERGIPCISRADYMGYLMTSYNRRIGISGMHGKSTCTSMCATALIMADTDPTVLSGAELSLMGGAHRVGACKENFLFEACEYMDSFLDFNPNISVVLNIEMDHVDYFESLDHIKRSYRAFAKKVGDGGCVVANFDDANVRDALSGLECRIVGFGLSDGADLCAKNIEQKNGSYAFDIVAYGKLVCRVELRVSGHHNIYNSLATAAVCLECGLSGEDIKRGLEDFGGAARRMEYKGRLNGARVYDDYAHHPTEIKTTLEGVQNMLEEGGRLFCVFQSHTYSRTAALLDGFAEALSVADSVLVCDIYAAREENIYGITPEKLASMINGGRACHGFDEPAAILSSEVSERDTVIVMGAGDVWKIFGKLDLKK
ncbi:MAG: UDP-N-acetylmuramate--L-alanine ligase [Ruminococcaceae bacterium]|nr:UDP-N-acetylmuramate--L-alanine ligase [Oscillospiraceae bacterium]